MFNGSENAPGDYFEPLREIGATDFNGTTWFDRTNYFQTVPTPRARARAVPRERPHGPSARRGRPRRSSTNQLGVVQNEKRQGDNQPYGLVEYAQLEALFPEGHPYRHSTIGSMADLDAASLEDVKQLVPRHTTARTTPCSCSPATSTSPTARPLVEKYFGDIPRGPVNTPAAADVPTLPAPKIEVMKDRVANTRLYRNWAVPGLLDDGHRSSSTSPPACSAASPARGSTTRWCASEQTAVGVTADIQPFHRVSLFEVQVDVKPGVDPALVAARLDEIIAEFIAQRPDRGRGPARRHHATSPAASAASSRSAASAARRSPSPRARSMPTTPASTRSSSHAYGRRHARRRCARRCRNG